MKKKTRSILEELNSFRPRQNVDEFIQSTGNNLIESSTNLISKIYETYDETTADELVKRFISSVRFGNSKKFKIGIEKIIESKKVSNGR